MEKNGQRTHKRARPAHRGYGKQNHATRLTLTVIMLFEFSASLLLAFRSWPIDVYALGLAVLLPLVAMLSVRVISRLLHADAMLVMLMNFLCGLGIILLYGLSPDRSLRQFVIYIAGIAVFILCLLAVKHIRDWRSICWLMIPAGITLLLLPVAIGQETNGAKNWIYVPGFQSFQPSEMVKLMLLLILAQYFSSLRKLKSMLPGLVFAVASLAALMLQKDLGTALMYYLVTLMMYWAASSNMPVTLVGAAGGVGAALIGYRMFAHVQTRVAIWLNPWSDALGKGYQLVQALTAIGSGGLFGLGLGMGQSHVIPAYSTDFIFAVLCEQFGIIFGLCVVGLYVIIVLRGIAISLAARTSFHALLALGCSLLIGLQTFVIIGGVVKLIPLTGITMPFVSYGGTSLLSCMGLMGLLCGVSAKNERDYEQDQLLAQGSEAIL